MTFIVTNWFWFVLFVVVLDILVFAFVLRKHPYYQYHPYDTLPLSSIWIAWRLYTTPRNPCEVLRRALIVLGPNGEHWGKGILHNVPEDRYCALGAINKVLGADVFTIDRYRPVRDMLSQAVHDLHPNDYSVFYGSIISFNDNKDTTFKDVEAVFDHAMNTGVLEGTC